MSKTIPHSTLFKSYFYKTEAGNEPVKTTYLDLPKADRQIIGKDLEKVKIGGPAMGLPTVDHLDGRLYEIRSTIANGKVEFRTLFRVAGNALVLLHAFQKTTQKTPPHDIDLANDRWRKAKGKQP